METKSCIKCGAFFVDGKHFWTGTNKPGNTLDLAGLVCNKFGNENCINPDRGKIGGDTWEKRCSFIDNQEEQ
jgi:hypothetical protein